MRSLLILGPAYAVVSAYLTYIPKEKYWETLERRAKEFSSTYEVNTNTIMNTKEKIVNERELSIRDRE